MKVKELIEALKLYNPDGVVVVDCEHGPSTAHDVVLVRLSGAGRVTLTQASDYIDNTADIDWN